MITRVDGRTTLQEICQQLAMSVDQVRRVVGQLWAACLVRFSLPVSMPVLSQEMSSVTPQPFTPAISGELVPQTYATTPVQPTHAATPVMNGASPSFTAQSPFETESQWGNGGNGATFVPGQGWVAHPQHLQPLQPSGALYVSQQIYAHAGQ